MNDGRLEIQMPLVKYGPNAIPPLRHQIHHLLHRLQNAGSSSSDAFCARYAWSNSTKAIGESEIHEMNAFPNPFVNSITLTGARVGLNRLRLFDATGRLAAEASGTLPLTLDLGLLPAGSYTAHVTSENGPTVFRLMKE